MWKTINTDKLVDTIYVSVYKDLVELPDGFIFEDFYTVRLPDAAMIAAITDAGEIILKSEYRYAIGEKVIECPTGMFENYESIPLVVAKRELLEETGYSSDNWLYLRSTLESTSKLTNCMHLFLATECNCISDQHLDRNEQIDVIRVSLKDAVQMVMDGKINANSSAHLILKADKILGGK